MPNATLRIGLFGIGLKEYWSQFAGLEDRLRSYIDIVAKKLAIHDDTEVINLGMVDDADTAFATGSRCRREEVDILFLYVTTYALSGTVLPVVREAGKPVVVLNLAPEAKIDYKRFNALGDRSKMTGEWLAYCSACPVPEIANVFLRSGIAFRQVTGMLHDDPIAWQEIADYVNAARVVKTMSLNRLGCMGHYYGGMLDIYTDTTLQMAKFGGHFEIIEVDELTALKQKVAETEIEQRIRDFKSIFDVMPDCSTAELHRAARTSVALDQLVQKYKLGSIAYYYKGTGVAENEDTLSSIILGNSLLTAKNVPVAGEYEIKNVQAMKIMDILGCGGSFTEFYAMDFEDDVVLMGHDGPGHLAIAEGKAKVKPLEVYHGKVGSGLSIEMSVKHGPVTLLSVIEHKEAGLALLIAEAESVPGPILEIGNTNSRYRFKMGARNFVNAWNSQGPAHHCAVGIGHVASTLSKLGDLLGLPVIEIS